MIDLHMHTTYSDGYYSVKELIDILNKHNIKYASITDHNSVDAHIEFKENKYKDLYKGKMISGVEIQTLVGDYLIEVLVYNFNVAKFKKYIDKTQEKFWNFHNKAYKELLKKADSLGLKYIEPSKELQNGYYCNMKFQEAINVCYEYNRNIISEEILSNHLYFYRYEFQNPKSIFFIDNKESFPKLEEVIENAHKCNGIVFLAHLDEYQAIKNKDEFLNKLIEEYKLDGVECFHPSITKENRKKYMHIAKNNNLLISAGSDFHGPHLSHRKAITTEATLEEINWLYNIDK